MFRANTIDSGRALAWVKNPAALHGTPLSPFRDGAPGLARTSSRTHSRCWPFGSGGKQFDSIHNYLTLLHLLDPDYWLSSSGPSCVPVVFSSQSPQAAGVGGFNAPDDCRLEGRRSKASCVLCISEFWDSPSSLYFPNSSSAGSEHGGR